jgi:signal transduction histidine kinase/ActR/RegA family two-component response regulator
VNLVRYSFGTTGRYRLWTMHILKRLFGRVDGPLLHGMLAGCVIMVISSLGLFYMWHSAWKAQLDAVRTELVQLARVAATLVDGDRHRLLESAAQAGSPDHLGLLAPLVKFHKATSDIIYVYTAILDKSRIYFVLGTDYLYRVEGDSEVPDAIMAPHDTLDPTLRRALEQHQVAVNEQPVKEAVRSYMSAYAPFYDREGRFVGVVGVDMWVRDFDARIGAIRRAGAGALIAVALLAVLTGVVVYRLSRTASRARRRDRIIQARLADAKQQAEVHAQRAEAASKAKSEFLAMMSHEIRTPMNGVLGFANLLLETPLNAEQREFTESMQRSGDALLTIINDVLDYSKIEAGKMSVEKIDFDLRSVCDEVRAILQAAVAERGLVMSLEYDAALPRFIKGDPARLRQVLLNLAGNAVKFTERGTVHIEVSQLDGAQVRISVIDSGIGIAADQMDRLFRRFTQADSSTTRRYGGTGLGLAISKTLVELMGGTIGAQSHEGTGSTFWVTLPLVVAPQAETDAKAAAQPPAAAAPIHLAAAPLLTAAAPIYAAAAPLPTAAAPIEAAAVPLLTAAAPIEAAAVPLLTAALHEPLTVRSAATDAAEHGGGRLLLVEDNFVNQRVAVYMLTKLGHQVDVARHGREAVAKLSQTVYDLVLMDCQMPEMDGFEATRIIRDRSSAVLDHEVPVVAMTANAFPEDRARALAFGMNDFLAKPVDRSVLASMLAKWLKPAQKREPRAAVG